MVLMVFINYILIDPSWITTQSYPFHSRAAIRIRDFIVFLSTIHIIVFQGPVLVVPCIEDKSDLKISFMPPVTPYLFISLV
jgi:hypothetical protein